MNQLNSGFSKDSDNDLVRRANLIVTNVGNNLRFASLASSLPPITAAADALDGATKLPPGQAREASIAATRAALITLLQHLADALEIVTGVTTADLAGTGFALRQAATHTSIPPDPPANVRLKATGISGELQVLPKAVARAAFYEVEYTLDPVNGPWTLAPAFTSTRNMVLKGLTRGKDYFVRVRAVATAQNRGGWSDWR